MFLRKFYNQGKSALINPMPSNFNKQGAFDKLKPQGSLILASQKETTPSQVSIQNFAFNSSTAKKNPNADLAGIGAVGGKLGHKQNRMQCESPA